MSELRQQMRADMVLRGLAPRTQQAYITVVAGLAGYYQRSPATLSQEEVQQYLLHLIEARKLAWASTNQAACALRFLFHVTLGQPAAVFTIPSRKAPSKLPEILSRQEVDRLLGACTSLRHRALLMTTYAAGLRVTETCGLKVADIDSERMMLRVANGKGGKDRYTLLSPRLLDTLRLYWRATRPAATSSNAPPAARSAMCIIRAATATAQHARRAPRSNGLRSATGMCCRCRTITWCLPCRMH